MKTLLLWKMQQWKLLSEMRWKSSSSSLRVASLLSFALSNGKGRKVICCVGCCRTNKEHMCNCLVGNSVSETYMYSVGKRKSGTRMTPGRYSSIDFRELRWREPPKDLCHRFLCGFIWFISVCKGNRINLIPTIIPKTSKRFCEISSRRWDTPRHILFSEIEKHCITLNVLLMDLSYNKISLIKCSKKHYH